MPEEKIKVFIVDDHPLIIEGLLSVLGRRAEMEVAGYAVTGNECMSFFNDHTADVVLLDIVLPDISGIELCRTLLKRKPALKILALSMFNEKNHVSKMLEQGARGYVTKNSGIEEIYMAINHVHKGHIFISKEAGDNLYRQTTMPDRDLPTLTRREKEILTHLADGLTASQIAGKLFVSKLTIDSHRRNLMSKLKAKNVAVLIKIALQNELI
ncbi:response regulator transcription factor [Fulvivirgaceae bacterium PWU4]|uniref:Response regulator transcription factor n=1 Tax=Chryseosolibacter histidini TaxID=2782349 RepID=A0AAP2DGI2_9BACT|nr:response regulator transcription factor [Chryseosolibacter histidini]MBT1695941.1 response regulator transcription factor [Chryseosolibacter histidini]